MWIKSVLWVVLIYSMMADNLPPWARKEIDPICRKFLWVGKDASVRGKMHGGVEHCSQADGVRRARNH